jgi:hypothetical protein
MSLPLQAAPASFTFTDTINSQETSEKKELFVLQWLSSLEVDLSKATRVFLV